MVLCVGNHDYHLRAKSADLRGFKRRRRHPLEGDTGVLKSPVKYRGDGDKRIWWRLWRSLLHEFGEPDQAFAITRSSRDSSTGLETLGYRFSICAPALFSDKDSLGERREIYPFLGATWLGEA